MTYTSRPIAPFKVDILSVGNPSSYTAGQKIPITAIQSFNQSIWGNVKRVKTQLKITD